MFEPVQTATDADPSWQLPSRESEAEVEADLQRFRELQTAPAGETVRFGFAPIYRTSILLGWGLVTAFALLWTLGNARRPQMQD